MSLPTPVPSRLTQEIQNCLRDIVRRSVDGTVIPLFVDNKSKRVLIGTVVAVGPNILQVTGDALITGLLTTGNFSTGSISASGVVWAGSLFSNGTLKAGSGIFHGPVFISGQITASGGLIGKSSSTDALNSLTTIINVSNASAPSSGQVLTATGGSAANWQTPSSSGSDQDNNPIPVFIPSITGAIYPGLSGGKSSGVIFSPPSLNYPPVSTRTVLTSGTNATYTTPQFCRQLRARAVGGGGGGGGQGGTAVVGGTTQFAIISGNALFSCSGGGLATAQGAQGLGGTATVNSGILGFSVSGNPGNPGSNGGGANNLPGGNGGSSVFGGAGIGGTTSNVSGGNGLSNSGSGGGGAGGNAGSANASGGGGAGGYVEVIMNTPAPAYVYTIGLGGSGGINAVAGGNGANGQIVIDEYY